jgi:uncharacterized membrane-anchored protein
VRSDPPKRSASGRRPVGGGDHPPYYALGLIGYVLKSVEPLHLGLDADVLTGLAFPIVFALVGLNVRRLRKKLLH